jgi:hypothetical protein
MALFNNALAQEIIELVRRRHQELGDALGAPAAFADLDQLDEESDLYLDLTLLIDVANGSYMRSDALVRQVERALSRLIDLLLGNPLRARASFPDEFWQTDTGILVSRARWWVSGEDLITISNAAALAFGENTQANRMRIARAMDNGALDWVPDPSVANPQQNRRVLRSQVERLRELRRLPE